MAEVKEIRRFKYWPFGGEVKIMLSNEEIEEIDAAASPITAITAFIPVAYVAPALAAIIAGYMYWIKKQNKKDGKRGVVISVKGRWTWLGWQRIPTVRSVDTW